MALTADQITAQNFKDFFTQILPYLNKGNGGTSDTPLGQMGLFEDVVAPYGWLVADGTVYNISDYPDLANHYERVYGAKNHWGGNGTTTFAVPDWQGEYFRACGTNSHTFTVNGRTVRNGSGGSVGTHQNMTMIPHMTTQLSTDAATANVFVNAVNDALFYQTNNVEPGIHKGEDETVKVAYIQQVKTTSGTAIIDGVRTTNTSLLCCIKAVPSSEMNTYSLTGVPCGTWIDGSRVYKKTIEVGQLPTSGSKRVDPGISNLKTIIKMEGVAISGTTLSDESHVFPMTFLNNNDASNTSLIGMYYSGGTTKNIVVTVGQDRSGFHFCYITFFYLTTD